MSQWLHVCGSIRIECMKMDVSNEQHKKDIEEALGLISTYDNPCKTNIPCGSEGSLEYKVIVTKETHNLNSAYILIYGDLRDYEYFDVEIIKWLKDFNKKGKSKFFGIADLCVKISNEFKKITLNERDII